MLFDCSVCGVLPVRECINSKVTIVVCCLLVLFAACLFHCRLVCLSCLICLLFDCQDSLIAYAEVEKMTFGEFASLICASIYLHSFYLFFSTFVSYILLQFQVPHHPAVLHPPFHRSTLKLQTLPDLRFQQSSPTTSSPSNPELSWYFVACCARRLMAWVQT